MKQILEFKPNKMHLLFKKWRNYLLETHVAESLPAGQPSGLCPEGTEQNGFDKNGEPFCREKAQPIITIPSRSELVRYIRENPNQKISLDNPKGSMKPFGADNFYKLPFDYGEWSNITNPADGDSWDLIIVPSATQNSPSLLPVGYLTYNDEKPHKKGNDKIIVAPDTNYTRGDKKIIESFFSNLTFFNPVVWY